MKVDKRTKAYKDSVKNKAPKGLGDIVEAVTKATGIKKLVEVFTPEGKDCGCDKRKKDLNLLLLFQSALLLSLVIFLASVNLL